MSEANAICASEEKPVEYRPIAEFPGYWVGDDGTVWTENGKQRFGLNADGRRPIYRKINDQGYYSVNLSRDGKRYTKKVHRLVLEAFRGPCPLGMEACHYPDPTRTNCKLTNLIWGTHTENMHQMAEHGNSFQSSESSSVGKQGEDHHHAKLNADIVREIRRLYNEEGMTSTELSKMFGVRDGTIRKVATGISWKHVA